MKTLRYSDIVPQHIQEYLLALRDAASATAWTIGDLTLEVRRYVRDNAINASIDEVNAAVASFAGKASRTVREYAMVAEAYPQPMRDRFPELSWNHFRVAMRINDPEKRVRALEWASSWIETFGRPATVDAMELYIIDEDCDNSDWLNPDGIVTRRFIRGVEMIRSSIRAITDPALQEEAMKALDILDQVCRAMGVPTIEPVIGG